MMRRLDKDYNEQITKNEFCDALLPMDFNSVVTFEENLEKEFYDLIRGPASKLNYFTEDQQDIWNKMGGQDIGVYDNSNQQRKFLQAVLPPSTGQNPQQIQSNQPQFGIDNRENQMRGSNIQNHYASRSSLNSPINQISHYQHPDQYQYQNPNQNYQEQSINRNSTKKRIYDPMNNLNSARGSPMKSYKVSPSNFDQFESIQKEGTTHKPHQTPFGNQNQLDPNSLQYSDSNQKGNFQFGATKSDLVSLKAQRQAQYASMGSDYLEKAHYYGN